MASSPSPAYAADPLSSPPGRKTSVPALSGTPMMPDIAGLLDTIDMTRAMVGVSSPSNSASTAAANTTTTTTTASFDPIAFLNKHYATEALLTSQLPALREAVAERMEKIDDRISNALQRQSETAASTRKHVQDAKASVIELEHRIRQIKEKASQSERAVLEITKDMKRLDCAKRHLQRTITTLKRLHMLVHAVEQLRQSCLLKPFPDYKTASHLIEATRLLFGHFSGYTQKVQPMRVLFLRVQGYEENLRTGLIQGFRIVAFGQAKALQLEGPAKQSKNVSTSNSSNVASDGDNAQAATIVLPVMTVEVMQGGVLLFNALGDPVRKQFIHDFSQDHLSDYLKDFEPPSREPKPEKTRVSSFKVVEVKPEPEKSVASLDQLEKRFTWFRDLVEKFNSKFKPVFPPKWNMQYYMAKMFLQLTRDHILALLDGPRKDPDASNATVLLKALQKTILFEKDISAWLQREFGTIFQGSDEEKKSDVLDTERPAPVKPLKGMASVAFESYMDPYIRLEEQSMDEQLAEALEDRTVDTRGERPVFISSTNLFVTIKGSISRCTALTKGSAFYLLYLSFKDSLRKYNQILNGKLPPPNTLPDPVKAVVSMTIPGSFGGKVDNNQNANASYRLLPGEEVTVCHVISTCEYCADTVEALEDLIRDTVDEEYQAKIDMMADQEVFHETTAKAIRVLVSGLSNRLENALKTMAAISWGTWDAVGEESVYVRTIHDEIQPMVIKIRALLPTSYFRSFCDKFASQFISTYFDNLVRLKKISEPGTQQLLLDIYSLKTLFLKLPILEEVSSPGRKQVVTGSTIAPAMYLKMVQKQFGRIETLLKLVGTPNELLIDNFRVQWANGKPLDLQIVMNLKGMKRNEQVVMLEKFGVDPVSAMKTVTAGLTGATIVSERVQALQDQGSTVAAKVNSDLSQMRQKVDDFRKSFR